MDLEIDCQEDKKKIHLLYFKRGFMQKIVPFPASFFFPIFVCAFILAFNHTQYSLSTAPVNLGKQHINHLKKKRVPFLSTCLPFSFVIHRKLIYGSMKHAALDLAVEQPGLFHTLPETLERRGVFNL
jgi:hypothetical protein